MCIHLFFGSFHDLVKKVFRDSLISKYSFILTFIFLSFSLFAILLKKNKKSPEKTVFYLNLLFIAFIVIELGLLSSKLIQGKTDKLELPEGLTACSDCAKPDIFFILADEYAGNTGLKDMFGFDNSHFTNQLSKRGFRVIQDSYSNYNYTPFAIGSMLDMNYIAAINNIPGEKNLTGSYRAIKENQLLKFLRYHGYDFYNYSVFDFNESPSTINNGLLPVKTKLITTQTLISRLNKDLRFNLITRLHSEKELKKWTYSIKNNNEKIYNLTWSLAAKKKNKPKFVYTHLELPHYPYYYDKDGGEQPFETLLEGQQVNKNNYIEYLQFGNKILLKLIDHILKNSPNPPIIILLGDHGFRHFTEPVENKYHYLNICSIYNPQKEYHMFRDSSSGVNFFRMFLNQNFRQKLNYLKDTTYYFDF